MNTFSIAMDVGLIATLKSARAVHEKVFRKMWEKKAGASDSAGHHNCGGAMFSADDNTAPENGRRDEVFLRTRPSQDMSRL